MQSNPWNLLSGVAPLVLADDRVPIERFNHLARPEHYIHTELLPEPFIGNPEAPVVLLNLNPGFDEVDHIWHVTPTFQAAVRANLAHQDQPWPFYPLNPDFQGYGGNRWWGSKLRSLIEMYGRELVSQTILVVELFPYHSSRFGFLGQVPSQKYSFELVSQAIKREALIVVMRAERRWLEAVPELQGYPYLRVASVQQPSISEGNLKAGWAKLNAALQIAR